MNTFRNVGLADGSEDTELSIRDLPNITVGDWARAPKASTENPIVIPYDIGDTIEVDNKDDEYLYTVQEVEAGITVKEENEDDITTDSGDESDARFDYDLESSFDDDIDGDKDEQDEDMK
jgi:hypothetical protein